VEQGVEPLADMTSSDVPDSANFTMSAAAGESETGAPSAAADGGAPRSCEYPDPDTNGKIINAANPNPTHFDFIIVAILSTYLTPFANSYSRRADGLFADAELTED
jgi:hypothetical protein